MSLAIRPRSVLPPKAWIVPVLLAGCGPNIDVGGGTHGTSGTGDGTGSTGVGTTDGETTDASGPCELPPGQTLYGDGTTARARFIEDGRLRIVDGDPAPAGCGVTLPSCEFDAVRIFLPGDTPGTYSALPEVEYECEFCTTNVGSGTFMDVAATVEITCSDAKHVAGRVMPGGGDCFRGGSFLALRC